MPTFGISFKLINALADILAADKYCTIGWARKSIRIWSISVYDATHVVRT